MLKQYDYEIRVQSRLAADWSAWFDGMPVRQHGEYTVLNGRLDQPALHGVLAKIRDLGLVLVSVHRLEVEKE